MSIFIAPDAEGTLTVWADVPGKDPVALITAADIDHAAVPTCPVWDPSWAVAVDGAGVLWRIITDNVPARADA